MHLLNGPAAEYLQANGSESSSYEHFQNPSNQISTQNHLNSQTPLYQDALSMGGAGFFPSQSGFQQPVSKPRLDHGIVLNPRIISRYLTKVANRHSITSMPLLDLTTQTFKDISAMSMIFLFQTTSERKFRKRQQPRCRPFQISIYLLMSKATTLSCRLTRTKRVLPFSAAIHLGFTRRSRASTASSSL